MFFSLLHEIGRFALKLYANKEINVFLNVSYFITIMSSCVFYIYIHFFFKSVFPILFSLFGFAFVLGVKAYIEGHSVHLTISGASMPLF